MRSGRRRRAAWDARGALDESQGGGGGGGHSLSGEAEIRRGLASACLRRAGMPGGGSVDSRIGLERACPTRTPLTLRLVDDQAGAAWTLVGAEWGEMILLFGGKRIFTREFYPPI